MRNEKGLTLVELLGSFVILSIILIFIVTILNVSAKTNRTSKEVIDATYMAQEEMEFIYKLSKENSRLHALSELYIPQSADGDWTVYHKESDHEDYYFEIKENTTSAPLIRIIVKVYEKDDLAGAKERAQMETLLKWGESNDQESP